MTLREPEGVGATEPFSEDRLSKRLRAMGFSEGIDVRFILKKRSLSEYKIGDTLIAVRTKEADGIFFR